MRKQDRARRAAPALFAALAGSAALAIAVLAATGAHVCHHAVSSGPAMIAGRMTGMGLPQAGQAGEGLCPVLIFAAALAAGLALLSLLAFVRLRAQEPAVLTAVARLVAGQRLAPLTACVGLAGALPLLAILSLDGGLAGIPALAALAALTGGALLSALGLAAAARLVLALAERLVIAVFAALRLFARGGEAPWKLVPDPLFVPAGVRLARRRPSRAPPVRR
ncbi:MAG: hypothetical protein JO036_02010 [Candidatus Eremiobacteraeota bacterium]|nr:hypothetical protein [Candidatus Eremiobacteraeota bacterium]